MEFMAAIEIQNEEVKEMMKVRYKEGRNAYVLCSQGNMHFSKE